MLDEITKDLAERLASHTDSRCASADEVRIAWLVSEVERLQESVGVKWVEVSLPWKSSDGDSFCGLGLNRPGTEIVTEDGRTILIGDTNELGGVCDDCPAIRRNTVIKRYAVVYEKKGLLPARIGVL